MDSTIQQPIQFYKTHGLGNDFAIINAIEIPLSLTPQQIGQLSDRHRGIGFDQLLVVEKARNPNTDFYYRIFNSDGREVEQCGNGARCVGEFLHHHQLTDKNPMTLGTLAGDLMLWREQPGLIRVNMGNPNLSLASERKLQTPLGERLCFTLSVGNPHAVFHVPNLDQCDIETLGPHLNQPENFPAGINVGFMQIIDKKNIKLRVYERSVGETQACGSGACAAVVAGQLHHLLDETVCVSMPGGQLTISWQGEGSPVMMTGPATEVFTGIL